VIRGDLELALAKLERKKEENKLKEAEVIRFRKLVAASEAKMRK
jgi:hypothetical protein